MKSRALMILATIVLAVCAPGRADAQMKGKKITLYYVDHGTPGNPFWVVYFRGIDDAAAILKPLGVEVKHLSSGADVKKQIDLLKQAAAANPDGLVTSMIDPKSFEPILKPLVDNGVPIMAVNVEDPRPVGQRIPYLAYYGEDTWKSGVELADAFIRYVEQTGGKKPQLILLGNPQAGHYVWEARLQKFAETLEAKWGTKSEKIVIGEDPTKAGEIVKASLVKNPQIDVIVTTNWQTHANVALLKSMGKTPGKDVYLAAFDPMPELLQDIKDGLVVATHDQQQYLQGFLPLMDLYLNLTAYGVHPFGIVGTGPIIIDKTNVDSVFAGTKAGYR